MFRLKLMRWRRTQERWPKSWQEAQERYGDIPGEEGRLARQGAYRSFFLRMGKNVFIEPGCRFEHPQRISLDDDVRINRECLIYGSGGISIGRHARIGPRVFIHSANHNVDRRDPRAFFERGYYYKAVDIEDNVLISADVRIMAGTTLGNSSFVAAGATLTGKHYPPGSYLAGTPAHQFDGPKGQGASPTLPSSPEIAIVIANGKVERYRLFQHLLSALGLPQVTIVESDQPLPQSIGALILDEGVEHTRSSGNNPKTWNIAQAKPLAADEYLAVRAPGLEETVAVPSVRMTSYRPTAEPTASEAQKARCLAPWLLDRLTKRTAPLSVAEFLDWAILLHVTDIEPGRVDRLAERIAHAMWVRWPRELPQPNSNPLAADRHTREAALDTWCDDALTLAAGVRKRQRIQGRSRSRHRCENPYSSLFLRNALNVPAALFYETLRAIRYGRQEEIIACLRLLWPLCNTGIRVLVVGLAARAAGSADLLAQSENLLREPAWLDDRTGFIRSQPGAPALVYSPLELLWFLEWCDQAQASSNQVAELPNGLFDEIEVSEPIGWEGFQHPGDPDIPNFIDQERRLISRSLIEVWSQLHSAPSKPGHHRVLLATTYNGTVAHLENMWLGVFNVVAKDAQLPLVRLHPWPAPYASACSIRYDVDRPITSARLRECVRFQALFLNAPCGSWFYRYGAEDQAKQGELLERLLQEVAVHAEHSVEAVAGKGVTHHSAPTSHYWQGDETLVAISQRGASYGEFHAAELPFPRPALWLKPIQQDSGTVADFWLMSLHFPMEGGTQDTGLEYFDRLLKPFRDRLAGGGHVILGTHPDLDCQPLRDLFMREDFSQTWFAGMETVRERVSKTLVHGAVQLVMRDGERALLSGSGIADLSVEIRYPDGEVKHCVFQLMPGEARPIAQKAGVVSTQSNSPEE